MGEVCGSISQAQPAFQQEFAMKIREVCIAAILALWTASMFAQGPVPKIAVPRPDAFFGATNSKITAANVNQNICKKGWSTKSIRPRTSYTNALKVTQLQALDYTLTNKLPQVKTKSGKTTRPDIRKCISRSSNPSCYEEDHLISLELGGNPTSPDNLWPEPWFGNWNAKLKDALEDRLHAMVCKGDISLREAQRAIATDWVTSYKQYVGQP
jgi:hypothetical protein